MKKARFGTKNVKSIGLSPAGPSPTKNKEGSSHEGEGEKSHFAYDPNEEKIKNSKGQLKQSNSKDAKFYIIFNGFIIVIEEDLHMQHAAICHRCHLENGKRLI